MSVRKKNSKFFDFVRFFILTSIQKFRFKYIVKPQQNKHRAYVFQINKRVKGDMIDNAERGKLQENVISRE